jgi:hypothetical protein
MSRLVEETGPRQIHRVLGGYVASCHDCRRVSTFDSLADARDANDDHAGRCPHGVQQ